MKIRMLLALVLATLMCAIGETTAAADTAPLTNAKHFFWAQGSQSTVVDSAANDLIYHGGNAGAGAIGVETTPAVYLVWWGPDWAGTGFQTADTDGTRYSSKTLQNSSPLPTPPIPGGASARCVHPAG